MRHDLQQLGPKRHQCRRCTAEYTVESTSSCPGVPLYRGGVHASDLVGQGLFTRTELSRRGRVLPKDAQRVAVLENAHHRRYPLFRLDQTVDPQPRSDAQRAAWASSRARRGLCGRCQTRPDHLIRRPEFRGHCRELLTVDRVCWNCYHATWLDGEVTRLTEAKATFAAWLERAAVIDFETTSLTHPAAIELAVCGRAGLLYKSFVNPGSVTWEVEASNVHRITPSMVADAPPWSVVQAELLPILASHGIEKLYSWTMFDRDVVRFERRRLGEAPEAQDWPLKWGNLQAVYDWILVCRWPSTHHESGAVPNDRSSLRSACKDFGVPPGTHRAGEDAIAAWAVAERLATRPIKVSDRHPEV